jgi:ribosome-binding protein aMBF1 (putative translation factor)
VKYKLICYGCGKATNEGYHVLCEGTIYHYCPECVEDEEAAKKNEEVKAIEKF